MAKKRTSNYRECEECGEPVENSSPMANLCKSCAIAMQFDRRSRDNGFRNRTKVKTGSKKGKRNYEEEFEYEMDYR